MAKISIQSKGAQTRVFLDGADITDKVSLIHFSHAAGTFPSVEVEFVADEVEIDGDYPVKVIKEGAK